MARTRQEHRNLLRTLFSLFLLLFHFFSLTSSARRRQFFFFLALFIRSFSSLIFVQHFASEIIKRNLISFLPLLNLRWIFTKKKKKTPNQCGCTTIFDINQKKAYSTVFTCPMHFATKYNEIVIFFMDFMVHTCAPVC